MYHYIYNYMYIYMYNYMHNYMYHYMYANIYERKNVPTVLEATFFSSDRHSAQLPGLLDESGPVPRPPQVPGDSITFSNI